MAVAKFIRIDEKGSIVIREPFVHAVYDRMPDECTIYDIEKIIADMKIDKISHSEIARLLVRLMEREGLVEEKDGKIVKVGGGVS